METDILGVPYRCRQVDLGTDDEGPVIATLVSRYAERPEGQRPDGSARAGRQPAAAGNGAARRRTARRAVLYVHGFVDYFFQTHLADFYIDRGWDFYALDLRKYGRSLQEHQTPNFCRSLSDYFPELNEAARIIREEDGHSTLLVNGHSTGGLIAALWTHARRNDGVVDGLFLNSPFFDLNGPWLARTVAAPAIHQLGRVRPYRRIPFTLGEVYGRSIHSEHGGEWTYALTWKPLAGFPVRAGWLRAIREGHQRLHAGLDIGVPVLVACSARSYKGTRWHESARSADAVLDVDHIANWSPKLGRHVTIVRIDGGMHDLMLSAEPARTQVLAEVERWMDAYMIHDLHDHHEDGAVTHASAGTAEAAASVSGSESFPAAAAADQQIP